MKTTDTATKTLIDAGGDPFFAEIFDIALADGSTILRHTSLDVPISHGGHTYNHKGLLVERSKIHQVRGLQVDDLTLTIHADGATIGSVPFLAAVRNGALVGATVTVKRVFYTKHWASQVGAITLFSGRVSDGNMGRSTCTLTVKSVLELFNIQWPKLLYQAGCQWRLYDDNCGLSKSGHTVSGVASSGSTVSAVHSGLSQSSGYFTHGVIQFTSGANSGSWRTVNTFAAGVVGLISPLLAAPANGDTFTIYPGCDKLLATCRDKFNNLAQLRAFPFVPVPETAI